MSDEHLQAADAGPDESETAIITAIKDALSNEGSVSAPVKQVNFFLRPGAIVAKSNSQVIFVCG